MNLTSTWQEQAGPTPPPIYFDSACDRYWVQDTRGDWFTLKEASMKRFLKKFLSSKAPVGAALSPLDDFLTLIQFSNNIHYAAPLAGTPKGIMEYQGHRILVTDSPIVLPSIPGDWPVLKSILNNLLVTEHFDQLPYFLGWLKLAREALRTGSKRPGQLLALAGPHDCGKSLVQNLITVLLGGRSAKPYDWMMGQSPFNSELFGAEHQMIEDEAASYDIRARRTFGAKIKEITVNLDQKCHAKYRPGIQLPPFWRLTVTVNDEPENLMILPPLDETIADKIILLRANKRPMPMPTASFQDRGRFRATLLAELPAFCAFLDEWQIPAELISERFGIKHFHHPDLLEAIDAFAPEARLWQLIENAILIDRNEWQGSAADLENALSLESSSTAYQARHLFTFSNACAVYLGRLSKKRPSQVIFSRTNTTRSWKLVLDPNLPPVPIQTPACSQEAMSFGAVRVVETDPY